VVPQDFPALSVKTYLEQEDAEVREATSKQLLEDLNQSITYAIHVMMTGWIHNVL